MREKQGAWELAKWIVIALAAVPVLYVGAYYCLAKPGFASHGLVFPHYRVYQDAGYDSDRFCERFFEPIHRIDRRLRPGVWAGDW
jgi:hypothetical protein